MGMHNLAMWFGKSALVLREKDINLEGPLYVRLVGRKSGLFAWLLTIIGVDITTTFEVYHDRIEYSYGSLSGRMLEMIPLSKVSNLMCGRFKPVMLFLLAFLSLWVGLGALCNGSAGLFFLLLILAVLFFFFYFLRKTIFLSVVPNSGSASAVLFKRSIIENQTLSDEEAKNIIDIINALVEQANK